MEIFYIFDLKINKEPKGNDRSHESQQVQSLDKVFFIFFFIFLFIFFIFEDLIKIEDAGVATTLKNDFSNIQGQLT